MNAPFDINELRANIGDEPEIERMLLTSFMESCSASLDWLQTEFPITQNDSYDLTWKNHMHQIKGAALNIGAFGLQEATKHAEDHYQAALAVRKMLLSEVITQFDVLQHFIRENSLA